MFPWRTWLYHPIHGAELFLIETEEEKQALFAGGWWTTPAGLDDTDTGSLLDAFRTDPESMELIDILELGKQVKARLLPNWKRETMIAKIREKLDGDNEATH